MDYFFPIKINGFLNECDFVEYLETRDIKLTVFSFSYECL